MYIHISNAVNMRFIYKLVKVPIHILPSAIGKGSVSCSVIPFCVLLFFFYEHLKLVPILKEILEGYIDFLNFMTCSGKEISASSQVREHEVPYNNDTASKERNWYLLSSGSNFVLKIIYHLVLESSFYILSENLVASETSREYCLIDEHCR